MVTVDGAPASSKMTTPAKSMVMNHSDVLNDTESLISKNREILEKLSAQLQQSRQIGRAHV